MIDFTLTWPEETYQHYSYGQCMHLAAAMHRILGWEIQATLHPADAHYPACIDHAWVVDPTGRYCLDSDGLYHIDRNGFISASNPLHTKLSETDLRLLTLIGSTHKFTEEQWDESVSQAMAVAQDYFPVSQIAQMHDCRQDMGASAKNEFDVTLDNLPTLYHGTTRRQWRKRHGEPSYLNLTSSRVDAENYASEWYESETDDFGNCHPMVVQIEPKALVKLLKRPGVQLQPDWGWVEGQEHDAKKNGGVFVEADATWQNSFSKCHAVGIAGFEDKFKKSFEVVQEQAHEME